MDNKEVKLVTFNIRRDSVTDSLFKRNAWQNRRDLIGKYIRQSDAAVVGVQELLPAMWEDMKQILNADYSMHGHGRTKSLDIEHAAIILKKDEIAASFDKTFWLSKRPDKEGSRLYYTFFPRICTVCDVYVKSLGQKIRIFNTHFDHIFGYARSLGARVVLREMHKLNEIEKLPTVLMGDLNAKPGSQPVRILSENLHPYPEIHLTSVYHYIDGPSIGRTYHGFRGKDAGKPIDYIFVSDEFKVESAYIDRTQFNGRYPSDHFPLVAVLSLK